MVFFFIHLDLDFPQDLKIIIELLKTNEKRKHCINWGEIPNQVIMYSQLSLKKTIMKEFRRKEVKLVSETLGF